MKKGLNTLKIWLCTCSNESRTEENFIKAKETKKASHTIFHYFVKLTVLNSCHKNSMFGALFHVCIVSLVAYPDGSSRRDRECFPA